MCDCAEEMERKRLLALQEQLAARLSTCCICPPVHEDETQTNQDRPSIQKSKSPAYAIPEQLSPCGICSPNQEEGEKRKLSKQELSKNNGKDTGISSPTPSHDTLWQKIQSFFTETLGFRLIGGGLLAILLLALTAKNNMTVPPISPIEAKVESKPKRCQTFGPEPVFRVHRARLRWPDDEKSEDEQGRNNNLDLNITNFDPK